MNQKEKLIEIINNVIRCDKCGIVPELIAEDLIFYGVTVQEWVPVNDKLPPYNHDVLVYRPNMAMKFLVDNYEGYYGEDDGEWYEGWSKYGTDIHGNHVITHWAYLPKPPKGE